MKRTLTIQTLTSLVAVAAVLVGCGTEASGTPGDDAASFQTRDAAVDTDDSADMEDGAVRPRMHWTADDAPTLLASRLTFNFSKLPKSGEPKVQPWPGHYWPTYHDGINYKWQGKKSLSPAGKYAKAVGLPVSEVEDAVSAYYGIDSHADRKKCTKDSQCDKKMDEECAIRDGEKSGYCIPTWFGICHAWAPAAIRYEEPKYKVVRNGVTFQPNDIKALVSQAHDRITSRFVSTRCDLSNAAGDIEFDRYGRPVLEGASAPCIDTNPGTLLVLVGNLMGIRGESFIEDRTFDDQVWNQPLSRYELTDIQTVSAQEANGLIGVAGKGALEETKKGTVKKGEWKHFGPYDVNAGERIVVTMTGKGDADVYLRDGARPTTTKYDCRPWVEGSNETCEYVAKYDTSVYVSVNGAAKTNKFSLKIQGLGDVPKAYKFNDQAKSFKYITMDLAYISESPATAAGPLLARVQKYVASETYTAIIELDGKGNIIGGEWTGASKQNHPDFLWSMLDVAGKNDIAGGVIKFDEVMSLYAESVKKSGGGSTGTRTPGTGTTDTGAAGPKQASFTDRVSKSRWKHFGPYTVEDGSKFTAKLRGLDDGDADLYVREGQKPTGRSGQWDCRPYKEDSNETCAFDDASGTYYVGVRGHSKAQFKLDISYVGQPGEGTD